MDLGAGLPSDFGRLRAPPRTREQQCALGLVARELTERGDGLPQEDAYLTVLRHGFDRVGQGSALELYFGTTSGEVFGSGDAGASWFTAASHLPPVYSTRVAG